MADNITLKYATYEVVFREFPDEITLAINIAGCPNNCPGCHSAYLLQNKGIDLTTGELDKLIESNEGITCIGFMGGDISPKSVVELSRYVKAMYPHLKTGWYSGRTYFPLNHGTFNYIKHGPYIKDKGPLNNPNTNQVMYENIGGTIENPTFIDITKKFWEDKPYEPKSIYKYEN